MKMKIAIVCYPTFGGSGVMATELGMSLVITVMRSILLLIKNLLD